MSSTTPDRQSLRLNSGAKKTNGPDSATKTTAPKGQNKTPTMSHHYTGSILSYKENETERSGYGVVGQWRKKQKLYEVQFTFADMEAPFEQVDLCPLQFVETNLIDQEVGRAWLDAVKAQQDLDTPTKGSKKRRNKRFNIKDKTVPESQTVVDKRPQDDAAAEDMQTKNAIPKTTNSDDDNSSSDSDEDAKPKSKKLKKKTPRRLPLTRVLRHCYPMLYARAFTTLGLILTKGPNPSCTGILRNPHLALKC